MGAVLDLAESAFFSAAPAPKPHYSHKATPHSESLSASYLSAVIVSQYLDSSGHFYPSTQGSLPTLSLPLSQPPSSAYHCHLIHTSLHVTHAADRSSVLPLRASRTLHACAGLVRVVPTRRPNLATESRTPTIVLSEHRVPC